MNHTTCSCPKWWQAANGPLIAILALGWLGFGGWWYSCKVRYMCDNKSNANSTALAEVETKPIAVAPTPVESSIPVATDSPKLDSTPKVSTPDKLPSLVKVFFAPDSALLQLDETELAGLRTVADFMKSNPKAITTVAGFATSLGNTSADEVNVGQLRAESVRSYLVAQGVANDRIITESKGANGVDDSGNPVSQATNRRAEITVKLTN